MESGVYHPSEWQKRFQAFSDEQHRLLKDRARGAKAEVRR